MKNSTIIKIFLSVVATTEIIVPLSLRHRGYRAFGGELLLIPLIWLVSCLYKELKTLKKEMKREV